MRVFNYKTEYQKLLTPEIVTYLSQIHEQKGQQNLFIEAQKDVLTKLLEIAKIQSTEASNRIEGIITTDDRLKKIVMNKTTPKSRSEREIAGYRDVLNTIHENYDYIPIRTGMILQLHRDLYKFSNTPIGGIFKISDNMIAEELADGTTRVRFQPVSAWETPEAIDNLCNAFQNVIDDPELDPLILIPMFILDFLCIHPFSDGNGRMSRLMTLLLLYRSGYIVGKYISIEKLIADTKETYYEALQESSEKWHGVREIIRNTTGKITKAQIMSQCPDISQTTVERALKELLDNEEIIKISGGRYTSYTWNWKKEQYNGDRRTEK